MQPPRKRSFFRDTSIYLISTGFTIVSSFLLLPIYTRHLTPADYGIFVLFMMFGNISANILSNSLHYVSFIEYFELRHQRDKFKIVNSTNALFLVALFVVSFTLLSSGSAWVSEFFFENRLSNNLIQLGFVSGCLEYFYLYFLTLLNAEEEAVKYAFINITRICLGAIIALVLIYKYSLTFMALIYSAVFTQITMVAVLFWLTRHLFSLNFSFSSLAKSLKFSFPLLPNSLMGLVYSSFDKTMLNKLRDTNSVSYFSFGEKFALGLKGMQDAASKSWNPYFLRSANENTEDSQKAIVNRYYELTFIYMAIGILIIYFAEELIKILATEPFYPSMYVVPLYTYYYIFASLGSLSMNQIAFSKKLFYVLPSTLLGLVANIGFNLILIPKFGAIGAAGATAIAALLTNLLSLYFGLKLHPLPLGKLKLMSMYLILIAFTIPVFPIMAWQFNFLLKIGIKSFLFIFFCLTGYYMNFISKTSIDLLRMKLKRIRFAADNS